MKSLRENESVGENGTRNGVTSGPERETEETEANRRVRGSSPRHAAT